MAEIIERQIVEIGADVAGFQNALRQVKRDLTDLSGTIQKTNSSMSGMEGGISNVSRGLSALGGVIRAIPAMAFLGNAIAQVMEAEVATAKLDAVLKSTGRTAGGTARVAFLDYAEAMEKSTMFSKESVLQAQTVLATFTQIGNDTIPGATQAILDMATVLGGDVSASAVQVGKALQDPINNITALKRAGVSFTDAQMRQIKYFQQTNQLGKAQAIILKELQIEFGGAAAAVGGTFAGRLDNLKDKFNDVAEAVGMAIMPILDFGVALGGQIADALAGISPILIAVGAAFLAFAGPIGGIIAAVLGPIGLVGAAIAGLVVAWNENWGGMASTITGWFAKIKPELEKIATGIQTFFDGLEIKVPWVQATGEYTAETKREIPNMERGRQFEKVKRGYSGKQMNIEEGDTRDTTLLDRILASLKSALPGILEGVKGIFAEIGAGVQAGFNAAVDWLKTEGPGLLEGAMKAATNFASDIISWVKTNAPPILDGIMNWINTAVDWIIKEGPALVVDAMETALKFTSDIWAWFKENAPDIGYGIGQWFNGALSWLVQNGAKLLGSAIQSIFSSGGGAASMSDTLRDKMNPSFLETLFTTALKTVENAFSGTVDFIFGVFEGLFGLEPGSLGELLNTFFGKDGTVSKVIEDGKTLIGTFITRVKEIAGAFQDAFSNLANAVLEPFRKVIREIAKLLIEVGSQSEMFAWLADIGKALQGIVGMGPIINANPYTKGAYDPGNPNDRPPSPMPEGMAISRRSSLSGANFAARGAGNGGMVISGNIYVQGVENAQEMLNSIQREAKRQNRVIRRGDG